MPLVVVVVVVSWFVSTSHPRCDVFTTEHATLVGGDGRGDLGAGDPLREKQKIVPLVRKENPKRIPHRS